MKTCRLPSLSNMQRLETIPVLRATNAAEAKLGELKGIAKTIPNEGILLNTLPLQEANASAAIENIVTTQDELYRSHVSSDRENDAAKEVRAHADSLLKGFNAVKDTKRLMLSDILTIQRSLIGNDAGIRTLPGTVLKNGRGEVVYTPPAPAELNALMANLVEFINDNAISPLNPLVKMALIHHQFESIHPFYDGNGRAGRIINLLYLVLQRRLDLPVLYLSRYILRNRADYYRLLQTVRDEGAWDAWILYMVNGIEETAIETIALIEKINKLLLDYKRRIREKFPRWYSQDLINALFSHPYTKISFVQKALNCSRPKASEILRALDKAGFVWGMQKGRNVYYINHALVECLRDAHYSDDDAAAEGLVHYVN